MLMNICCFEHLKHMNDTNNINPISGVQIMQDIRYPADFIHGWSPVPNVVLVHSTTSLRSSQLQPFGQKPDTTWVNSNNSNSIMAAPFILDIWFKYGLMAEDHIVPPYKYCQLTDHLYLIREVM